MTSLRENNWMFFSASLNANMKLKISSKLIIFFSCSNKKYSMHTALHATKHIQTIHLDLWSKKIGIYQLFRTTSILEHEIHLSLRKTLPSNDLFPNWVGWILIRCTLSNVMSSIKVSFVWAKETYFSKAHFAVLFKMFESLDRTTLRMMLAPFRS